MTFKLYNFNTLKDIQIKFKLTMSKLYESGKHLPKDLQIATFLHGMEKTYCQWVFAKQYLIRGKRADNHLLTVDDLIAKLLNELCTNIQL